MPSWRDPRLAVGVLLVLAAVVAGSRLVAAADRTVPVFAAAQVLTPGDPVGAEDLDVVRVRVDGGAGAGAYVAADDVPGEGLVALRGVGAGELVPAAALGPADAVEVRPVGVPVTGALPDGLVPGALVDVWVTAVDPTAPGARLDPRRVVVSAPVAEVDDDAGGLGTAAGTTVQVLVGTGELPDVLAALAADSRVALVLSPGGEQGSRRKDAAAPAPGEAVAEPVPAPASTTATATGTPSATAGAEPEEADDAASPAEDAEEAAADVPTATAAPTGAGAGDG